jgi:hypothetical protein
VLSVLFEVYFPSHEREGNNPFPYIVTTLHCKTQNEAMKVNARKETSLRNDVTGACLELDVWFPQLHLAFEFQVTFHFHLQCKELLLVHLTDVFY